MIISSRLKHLFQISFLLHRRKVADDKCLEELSNHLEVLLPEHHIPRSDFGPSQGRSVKDFPTSIVPPSRQGSPYPFFFTSNAFNLLSGVTSLSPWRQPPSYFFAGVGSAGLDRFLEPLLERECPLRPAVCSRP